jgi:sugar phosphate isomerase/epimerase
MIAELEFSKVDVAIHEQGPHLRPSQVAADVALAAQQIRIGPSLSPAAFSVEIAAPDQGKNFDQVYPYVRHVHLRDTGRGPDQFQVRVGQGQVEYGRVIAHLARYSYDRLLTVEICDIADAPYAMDTEVRKLKYLLESLV